MNVAKNLVVFLVFHLLWCLASGATPSIQDQCTNELQKVTACLTFAIGKQDTPSKECCTSATDIKEKNPVCLCYIIQQIHDGSNPQLKSTGIQEARLLQLPSDCKLQNASSSDCPKLLNLAPNSPDAAFFTNASASATPSSPATIGKSSPAADSTGTGYKHQVDQLTVPVVSFIVAVFVCVFSGGWI